MARRTKKGDRPGEFELIERYFAPLAAKGAFGFKDDAALLAVGPGKSLVVTQDALAAGVHFFADDPPGLIARKALRVNLSDLAAKGAAPSGFSLALGLAEDWREPWIAEFVAGLGEDCRHYGVELTGGDTFRSPGGTVISITAWGEIDAHRYRARLGAGAGDRLFVTGTIGDGAVGLIAHRRELARAPASAVSALAGRYLLPDPPVEFAPLIAEFATASMDISDGLVGDAGKLARASGIDIEFRSADVPLSAELAPLASRHEIMNAVLTGGDDYQFLFTVDQTRVAQFLQKAQRMPTRVTELGVVREGGGRVTVLDEVGAPMRFDRPSWDHF